MSELDHPLLVVIALWILRRAGTAVKGPCSFGFLMPPEVIREMTMLPLQGAGKMKWYERLAQLVVDRYILLKEDADEYVIERERVMFP